MTTSPQQDAPDSDNEVTPRRVFDGAILVGFATIIGYAQAYIYHVAYANYFGIPFQFVSVTIESVCLCAMYTLAFIAWPVLTALIVRCFYKWKPRRIPPRESLFWILAVGVISALSCLLFDYTWVIAATILVLAGMIADEIEGQAKLHPVFRVIVVSIILLGVPLYVGFSGARTKTVFPVETGQPDNVLLAVYGDKAILGKVNLSQRSIEPIYTVTTVSGKAWELHQLGRLRSSKTAYVPNIPTTSNPSTLPTTGQ